MKKLAAIIAVTLLSAAPFFADDLLGDFGSSSDSTADQTTAAPPETEKLFELSLLGEHKGQIAVPVQDDYLDFEGGAKTPKFLNDLGVEIRYKNLKLVSHWELDAEIDQYAEWTKMFKFKPLENAIYYSPWKFKIGLGLQYYSWGLADEINPSDNVNPRDYSAGPSAEKIPLLSASISFYPIDWFSIDGLYAPFEQSNQYPKDAVKAIPSSLFRTKENKTGYSDQELLNLMTAHVTDSVSPGTIDGNEKAIWKVYLSELNADSNKNAHIEWADYDPKNFLAGGRVNFFTPYCDLSLSYLYDVDPFYTPEIEITKEDLGQLYFAKSLQSGNPDTKYLTSDYHIYLADEISLERRRIHQFGFNFKTTVSKFGIWLEANYSLTDDYMMDSYKIRNHKLAWTLGTDFNFGPQDKFYMNVQYAGTWVPKFDDTFYTDYRDGKPDKSKMDDKDYVEEYMYRALTQKLGSQYAGLMQGLTAKLKFPLLNDILTPSVTLAYMLPLIYDYNYEVKYGSAIIKPELDIMPFDSFHILIGAELCYAWHKLFEKNYVEIDRDTDQIGIYNEDNHIYIAFKYKWGYDLKK